MGFKGHGGGVWGGGSEQDQTSFLKTDTQKSNGHTNTNPVKNTKIGLLYLIERGWVEGVRRGRRGVRECRGEGSWDV